MVVVAAVAVAVVGGAEEGQTKVSSIVPPILTCLVGKRLGDPSGPGCYEHYKLRDYAASLLKLVCRRFGSSSHTLLSRLTRACLKHFLDPTKPLGTHYGAIVGLAAVGGRESVRVLILPNLRLYEKVLRPEFEQEQDDAGAGTPPGGNGNSSKKRDAQMVVEAIFNVLTLLEEDCDRDDGSSGRGIGNSNGNPSSSSGSGRSKGRVKEESADDAADGAAAGGREGGDGDGDAGQEELREQLARKTGDIVAERVCRSGRRRLVRAILDSRMAAGPGPS